MPPFLKRFVFYKAPPSDKHSLLWLASWQCIVIGPTPQAQASAVKIKVKS